MLRKINPTKGPWAIKPVEDKDYIRIRGTVLGSRYKIANVPIGDNLEEAVANATLIRAAGDMLEALKLAYNTVEREMLLCECAYGKNDAQHRAKYARHVYDKVKAAIAKAEVTVC